MSSRTTGLVLEDRPLLKLGIERRVAVRCLSYDSAYRVVTSSDDVLTVPRFAATDLGSVHVLVRRPLPFALPPFALHLYWHLHAEEDPANVWLRALLARIVRGVRAL